jgi:DNA/RNA-binding domain of Phe-tRNA-synthetase-like protein
LVEVTLSPQLTGLKLGVVTVADVAVFPASQELRAWSDEVARRAATEAELPENEELRQQVRQMLRHGKFKASGRSKPAQEYLLRCATQEHALPNINAPVDILNTVSLQAGLPISLLSIAKCSPLLNLRYGVAGESYVFNSVGQELDATDLIVVCDRSQSPDRPVGSPIKDSLAGKIETGDEHLVAVIYAPNTVLGEGRLKIARNLLVDSFHQYCPPCVAVVVE